MVVGHRGGFMGPENSMKAFRNALLHKLEGIEFDIWLSKDNIPVITHGGANGQLEKYDYPEEFVFNWKLE
jgi:glycerophosphoryl diester phosphodiesterase